MVGAAEHRDAAKQEFLQRIGMKIAENEQGAYGYQEIVYPNHTLPYLAHDITSVEMIRHAGDQRFAGMDGKNLLFIDTETTGLAGGTGTLPFLVGAGFFTEEGFRVRQYFMRDYEDEPAVLAELHSLSEAFQAVCTYNGKGFDIPLLNSRFLLNRKRTQIANWPHFDLLYPARRFWRELLPNCRLSTVEAHIFKHTRDEDIPGELIPYVYFDFLRGIRMERIRPVLAHNAEDIRTLALIAAKTCRMLHNPLHECEHPQELLAIGRCFAAECDWQQAGEFFERALNHGGLPDEMALTIRRQLSLIFKRGEQFEKAVQIWQEMKDLNNDCFAHIELAKYYEHKEKRLNDALLLTEQALEICRFVDVAPIQIESLHHRRSRLLRKLGIQSMPYKI